MPCCLPASGKVPPPHEKSIISHFHVPASRMPHHRVAPQGEVAAVQHAMQKRVEDAVADAKAQSATLRESREKNVHFSARVVALNSRVAQLTKQVGSPPHAACGPPCPSEAMKPGLGRCFVRPAQCDSLCGATERRGASQSGAGRPIETAGHLQ